MSYIGEKWWTKYRNGNPRGTYLSRCDIRTTPPWWPGRKTIIVAAPRMAEIGLWWRTHC